MISNIIIYYLLFKMEYGENVVDLISTLQSFSQYSDKSLEDIIDQFETIEDLKRERDLLIKDLITTLQYFDKYKDLSATEIINQFDNVEEIQAEKIRLLQGEISTLKNVYQLKEQNKFIKSSILTGNLDVNYHILLNLEPKDIARYCKTNSLVKKLCQDEKFWEMKFKHDQLYNILYLNNHVLSRINKLPLYDFYQQGVVMPLEELGWINLYNNIFKSHQYAKYILTIYHNEYINTNNKIIIRGNNFLILLLINAFLPLGLFKQTFSALLVSNQDLGLSIVFDKNNNSYSVITLKYQFTVPLPGILLLLSRALLYQMIYIHFKIVDINNVDYLIPEVNMPNIRTMRYSTFKFLEKNGCQYKF